MPALDAGAPAPVDGVVLCPFGLPDDAGGPDAATQTYRRDCTTASDCAIGVHLNNCCGQQIALGVRASEKPRFDDGGGCGGEPALCECAPGPTLTDDGETTSYNDPVAVTCTMENCNSYPCTIGRCQSYPAQFACGSNMCDSRTQFCQAYLPGILAADAGGPSIYYQCAPLPAACAAAPSCACVTAAGGQQVVDHCDEGKHGRVTVTYAGI
jgi:hypothetical protein